MGVTPPPPTPDPFHNLSLLNGYTRDLSCCW